MSSVTRAIDAMDLLARKGPLGVRAISKELAMPLGSTHRLLEDLATRSVAERDTDGEWALSFRLLEITGLQLDRLELPQLARPFAERIALATGETVNVNALGDLEGVCIDKVRGSQGMQVDLRIGSRGPLHAGGASKAMLAYLPPSTQERIFDSPRKAFTPHTLVESAVLRAELARIRQRGYAIDDQEVVTGIYCVAMPFLGHGGRPIGAMSITGATPKVAGPEIRPLVEMLDEACEHVSRRLGYVGPWPLVDEAPAESGRAVGSRQRAEA